MGVGFCDGCWYRPTCQCRDRVWSWVGRIPRSRKCPAHFPVFTYIQNPMNESLVGSVRGSCKIWARPLLNSNNMSRVQVPLHPQWFHILWIYIPYSGVACVFVVILLSFEGFHTVLYSGLLIYLLFRVPFLITAVHLLSLIFDNSHSSRYEEVSHC